MKLVEDESVETPTEKHEVEIDDALKYTGFGKYNVALIFACGITLFTTNSEAYSVGYILPSAECDLELNTYMKGILTSAAYAGIMTTNVFWGYLSDRIGRRKLLLIHLSVTFVASSLSAFMPSFWGFAILRFIVGVCISGPSSTIYAYFGEFNTNENRSKFISYISLFIALALTSMPSLGWLILPRVINYNLFGFIPITSWRIFVLVNAIPSFVTVICLSMFPESPIYLYRTGKVDAALEVLKSMYAVNTGKNKEDFPVQSLNRKAIIEVLERKRRNMFIEIWTQLSSILKPPILKYSLTGSLLQAGIFSISSGLFLWYPDIIKQLSIQGGNSSLTICEALSLPMEKEENVTCSTKLDSNIFIQNIILGVAYFVGYSSWGLIVKALGNRNFFMTCMAFSGTAVILLCFISDKLAIDMLFVLSLFLSGICVSVVSAMLVNLVPTHLCGITLCLAFTCGRLGSIVTGSVLGILLAWNCHFTFSMYAVFLFLCLLGCLIFPRK